MVPPVDQRKLVRSTVHAKAVHVMTKDELNRLYGSQKKAERVDGVVVNVDQQITNIGRRNYMLSMTTKIIMEMSIGTGYIIILWLQ